jgi:uncharacterized membrane protein
MSSNEPVIDFDVLRVAEQSVPESSVDELNVNPEKKESVEAQIQHLGLEGRFVADMCIADLYVLSLKMIFAFIMAVATISVVFGFAVMLGVLAIQLLVDMYPNVLK